MAYEDRAGITDIRPDKHDRLSISWDYDSDPNDLKDRRPVFLYTPDMSDTSEHFHIELSQAQAVTLRDWLNKFIAEVGCNGTDGQADGSLHVPDPSKTSD